MKDQSPRNFDISECELQKQNNHYDESCLKNPGYDIRFPLSWILHGYARIVVYVKSTLEYQQFMDL